MFVYIMFKLIVYFDCKIYLKNKKKKIFIKRFILFFIENLHGLNLFVFYLFYFRFLNAPLPYAPFPNIHKYL